MENTKKFYKTYQWFWKYQDKIGTRGILALSILLSEWEYKGRQPFTYPTVTLMKMIGYKLSDRSGVYKVRKALKDLGVLQWETRRTEGGNKICYYTINDETVSKLCGFEYSYTPKDKSKPSIKTIDELNDYIQERLKSLNGYDIKDDQELLKNKIKIINNDIKQLKGIKTIIGNEKVETIINKNITTWYQKQNDFKSHQI